MQPQWIVPSKKPKDLEIGWKEICENSVCYTSPSKRTQKRMSDFSGLISTEVATEISHGLINPSVINSDVRMYLTYLYYKSYAKTPSV